MLTEEEKQNNKMKYLSLLTRLNIDLTSLNKYLDGVNYFEKPATSQYKFSYAGGLCEQALRLCHELGMLCEAYFPGKYSEEDVIKVALFKELYRAEMYETYNRNIKNEDTGAWETIKSYRLRVDRPVFGELNFSSYMIIKHFFPLTEEQIEAIIYSSGVATFTSDIHEVLTNYPLVTLTKMADLVVNHLI